jgi:hypothetical protein
MLEEVIDGSSNGQHFVLMDKGKAYYCGFVNLAADKGDGASITKYAQVNMKAGTITITFADDASIFSWENYEIYKGKDVSFVIDTQNPKEGIKPTPNSAYKPTATAVSGNYPMPEEKLDNPSPAKTQAAKKDDFSW